MHLLATTSASIDDLVEPVDLRQPPGDIVILSFADSDLAGLAVAWAAQRDILPTVRLANLRDLRHPLSVDLWLESVGQHAKVVVVRLLGGLDWWRYGVERLSSLARERSIALAFLPGEDRDDPRLADASTLPDRRARRVVAVLPRGRAGEPAIAAPATCATFRLTRRCGRAASAAADGRIHSRRGRGRSRTACRVLPAGSAESADPVLPRDVACGRHGADRCALPRAGRARACTRSARGPEPEGSRGGRFRAIRARAARACRYRDDDGVRSGGFGRGPDAIR